MGTGDITQSPVGELAARVDDEFDAVVNYATTRSGGRKVREDLQTLTAHYGGGGGGASAQEVADQSRIVAALDYAVRRGEARSAAIAATRQAATAPASAPTTLRATVPFVTRQGYHAESVVAVDGRKVRVTVYRDAYDRQSQFRTEVWTGAGWQFVSRVHGDDAQGKAMPSYVLAKRSDSLETVEQATQQMRDRLLADARMVLRNTPVPDGAAVTRRDPVVVSGEAPRGNRQGYDSVQVVEVDGHKVRTRVHADTFYQFQSSMTAEVWTDGGWKQAASIHPLDPAAPALPRAGALNYPTSTGYQRDATVAAEACAVAHDQLIADVRSLF